MGLRSSVGSAFACAGWLALVAVRGIVDADKALENEGAARAAAAFTTPRFASGGGPTLAFAAVGDTGWANATLDLVVDRMNRSGEELGFSFVLLLGDNFYRDGVESDTDPMWTTHFEQAFGGPDLDVPFYAALGNHDHNGNVRAQVEYTDRETRWTMPGTYYAFTRPAGGGREAEFFVLDSSSLIEGRLACREQLRWLEQKLASSTAEWKIVVSHHPLRSSGEHGGSSVMRGHIEDLVAARGVALVLSGHDHDLELQETVRGYLQVVSGAGASTRAVGRWSEWTRFASERPGFAWVGIDGDEMWIALIEAAAGPVYSRRFTLEDPGAVDRASTEVPPLTGAPSPARTPGSPGSRAAPRTSRDSSPGSP